MLANKLGSPLLSSDADAGVSLKRRSRREEEEEEGEGEEEKEEYEEGEFGKPLMVGGLKGECNQ